MLRIEKVVGSLPDPITASTLYFVRVGLGLDIYVSDSDGMVAHKVNTDGDQVLLTRLHELYNSDSDVTADDTIGMAISKLTNKVNQLSSALSGKLDIGAEAETSKKWTNPITLSLSGALRGEVSFDGSQNVELEVTLLDIDMGNIN